MKLKTKNQFMQPAQILAPNDQFIPGGLNLDLPRGKP